MNFFCILNNLFDTLTAKDAGPSGTPQPGTLK